MTYLEQFEQTYNSFLKSLGEEKPTSEQFLACGQITQIEAICHIADELHELNENLKKHWGEEISDEGRDDTADRAL